MQKSKERSHRGPRQLGPAIKMALEDVREYGALADVGIYVLDKQLEAMAEGMAMDDQQGGLTTPSIGVPVQALQSWLPGLVRTSTAPLKIDEFIGITTAGDWEDEEIVQLIVEPTGNAVPYGDYTNVPLASYNPNFERRTVVRFEQGFKIGRLEEARNTKVGLNAAAEKRIAAGRALDIQRNAIGFFGFNGGANRTYGFLNDPGLPSYVTVANGAAASPLWLNKTFLEIIADIRSAFVALQTQSQDMIGQDARITLALPTNSVGFLSVTSIYGNSVNNWIKETYPNLRIVSAPQLNAANGGANVFYLYAESVDDGGTDNGRVFDQIVPAKFITLGVEMQAKARLEDFSNAMAGVIVKRPWAIVRRTGI